MTDANQRMDGRIPSSAEPLPPETLAAFLDGALDPEERQSVLERLADDADARRVLLDASAAMHDEETAEYSDVPVSSDNTKWQSGRLWIPLSAAAMLVLVPAAVLLQRRSADPYLLPVAAYLHPVAATSDIAATSWGPQRGSETRVADDRIAYRAGAILVRLRYAWAANLPAGSERAALDELLARPGSAAVLSVLDAEGRPAGMDETDAAAELTASVRTLLAESPHFDLGIWTEQLRLSGSVVGAADARARQARRLADRFDALGTADAATLSRLLRSAAGLLEDGDVGSLGVVVDSIAIAAGGT